MKEKRVPHALYCDDKSLAQQHMAAECDINTIVERAKNNALGLPPPVTPASFGDFTVRPSYQEAFAYVKQAEAAFMTLDAFVRERFANDPGRMIEFLQDPKNQAEAVKLGLIVPRTPAQGDEVVSTLKSIDKRLADDSKRSSAKQKGVGGHGTTAEPGGDE